MTQRNDSPILYLQISRDYSRAFQIIWDAEFAGKNEFYHDRPLILGPISNLLGVALENAMRGLQACRKIIVKTNHDLGNVVSTFDDKLLYDALDQSIQDLVVPDDLLEANPTMAKVEVETICRTYTWHISALNCVYNAPFVSRYPVLGGHSTPNPMAIDAITKVFQAHLDSECRTRAKQQTTPATPT